jgi:hypothetical protein
MHAPAGIGSHPDSNASKRRSPAGCSRLSAGGHNDILSTKRDYRAEARPVFEDMRRILELIRNDEELHTSMSMELSREIEEVLDRRRECRSSSKGRRLQFPPF